MKLNFTIEVDSDNENRLEQQIIKESAKQLISEQLYNRNTKYGCTYREQLMDSIKRILFESIDTDFKNEVKELVIEDISKKYIRSKQYKDIKDEFEIVGDTLIKSGMQEIISDLVNKELNRRLVGK